MKIDKVVNPGHCATDGYVFCHIKYDGDKLSITGVVGPKSNGDANGGCGQIVGQTVDLYAPGWDADTLKQFYTIWREWHLNDMRAGCEHQRAEGWGKDTIELVTYRLTSEAFGERNLIERGYEKKLKEGATVTLTKHERTLLNLPYETYHVPDSDGPEAGYYKVHKRENKLTTWVRPEEHPQGVLCKPCPVCGYAFGSSWLKEDVPADVLAWLDALPETTKTPAWV